MSLFANKGYYTVLYSIFNPTSNMHLQRTLRQELCDKFGLQHPALSYHVSKLLSAGFVTTELAGEKTYYSADRSVIDGFISNFTQQMG